MKSAARPSNGDESKSFRDSEQKTTMILRFELQVTVQ